MWWLLSKSKDQERQDKPIEPGHLELRYQSSLEGLLADMSVKLSLQLRS